MRLVLFDIDGTLIDSGGAGSKALGLAFEKMFSVKNAFRGVSMAGKTDLQILKEGLALHGIGRENGVIPEFFRAYIGYLKETVLLGKGHVKPGIFTALDTLAARSGSILGLLTGNISEGARIKLDAYGLSSYFRVGAYGDDSEDRNRLLPVAVRKVYEADSVRVGFEDCVVIGDTPRDVDCAKPYGAKAVGVATGPYSSGALRAAGADAVFEDLSDTDRFIAEVETG
ncbi:MAG: HAD family hydrolase [Nitrospiraceae bacterium]|nr:HAD family hydrolase [Nitrospiraceae bacterium]